MNGTLPEDAALSAVADWLSASSSTVVLTGAGMSTESGLPDFRSTSGWWKQIDPRRVASVEALEQNYSLFAEFYRMRLERLHDCQPHRGHLILAEWERRGIVSAIVTQNVDGLHQRAGSNQVAELHGSLSRIRCHACGTGAAVERFMNGDRCGRCGGKLRPAVVLFGEMLPEDAWEHAVQAISRAELLLVIGTSLEVYPASQLPLMTRGRVVMINAEETALDHRFALTIRGKAGETLQQLERLLTGKNEEDGSEK
ncbi:NAD-dependent deacylase [Brevibacillus sp. SYP-B805]|uniref:SIR2 family NAD-dependent protein deacylase n=1 Tax=Brevibacillus sp. SYP-B805 TaxID=1578199 RepID=UPI0013EB35EC|nr:NAD-dependent deacylase [Brevibacillus sp. SYP-B805]NGQ97333.1 NAD-dependent deacylase [Brevibacillus sp. SYP-B805]